MQALGITFPGPVLGMGLLFAGLSCVGRSGAALDAVADTILRNLSLLFVPAAVGVMQQAGLIAANWLAIFAALAISTAATLVVTVYTFRAVARLTARRTADERAGADPRLGLPLGDPAALADGDARRLRCRRRGLRPPRPPPAGQPGGDRRGAAHPAARATGTSYGTYFAGAQFVHFLLGPATVALGLPLWRNRAAVARNLLPMCAALVAGSITAIGSAVLVAWALGAPREILASLAAKSVTAPIAMALTESIGGIPALAAVHRGADRHPRLGHRDAADERARHPRLRRPRLRRRRRRATASARRAPSRSARRRAPSPASPWG